MALCLAPSCSAQWYLFPGSRGKRDTTSASSTAKPVNIDSTMLFPGANPADSVKLYAEEEAPAEFVLDIPEYIDLSMTMPFRNGSQYSTSMMDFYCGALMAARDLGRDGIKINFKVADLAEREEEHQTTLSIPDVLIGPVSPDDILSELLLCPEDRFIVSPLDPVAAALADSGAVIQAPATWERQADESVEWMRSEFHFGDRLVVIRESGAAVDNSSAYILSKLAETGIKCDTISYGILQGRNIFSTFEALSSQNGTTHYFILSENEAFVGDAVRNISMMTFRKHEVALYATSRLRSFSTIEAETLHDAKARIATGYYVDYQAPDVKKFVLAYRAFFGAEPTAFSFSGYDVTHYFVNICARYGRMWPMKLSEYFENGLQSSFRFEESDKKGFVNQAVRRLSYAPDYELTVTR